MMGAITKFCAEKDALLHAARAGAHALLYPLDPWGAIDTLESAVRSGGLDEEVVDRAVDRIWEMKRRARILDDPKVDPTDIDAIVGCAEHEAAADRIAEASITKVFGELPVGGAVRYAAMRDESARGDLTYFERGLRIDEAAETGVLAIFSGYRAFSGRAGPDERQIAEALRDLGPVRTLIVVTFGNPYVRVPGAKGHVCAWSECRASQVAAARALRGEIPFRGKLPVALDGQR
jgi:beta-N-acetylhexosaminidase